MDFTNAVQQRPNPSTTKNRDAAPWVTWLRTLDWRRREKERRTEPGRIQTHNLWISSPLLDLYNRCLSHLLTIEIVYLVIHVTAVFFNEFRFQILTKTRQSSKSQSRVQIKSNQARGHSHLRCFLLRCSKRLEFEQTNVLWIISSQVLRTNIGWNSSQMWPLICWTSWVDQFFAK